MSFNANNGKFDDDYTKKSSSLPPSLVFCDSASDNTSVSYAAVQSKNETLVEPNETDPFADVRERMESLRSSSKTRKNETNDDMKKNHSKDELLSKIPLYMIYLIYLSYTVGIAIGRLRDFVARVTGRGRFIQTLVKTRLHGKYTNDCNPVKFTALLHSWENFYRRRFYLRIQDVFNRPISSNPGSKITVLERVSDDNMKSMKLMKSFDCLNETQRKTYENNSFVVQSHDGKVARRCLNLGSYNYLSFADDWQSTCAAAVKNSLVTLPISSSSSALEFGITAVHRQLERTVAEFLGKDDAIVLSMGFNTNATVIPSLVSQGDLIISDELNHTSIVNGARASGAVVRVFRHNDAKHLEEILRESIIVGRPRVRRPWNKIIVVVEGIYSMEGVFCNLSEVVKIAKRYGAYIYLDEAHSIGASGVSGRGCAEHFNVDVSSLDIMMGTFTKSFGGMGGYIAADQETIAQIRNNCAGFLYHNALCPIIAQQVLTSLKIIIGEDGTDVGIKKIQSLRDNSNYFRMRLKDMGLMLLGEYDSPIIPIMLYHPAKICAFSRECYKRGIAVVVVGFPAVPILLARARICMSAGLTRDELDYALDQINEIADLLHIKYDIKSLK